MTVLTASSQQVADLSRSIPVNILQPWQTYGTIFTKVVYIQRLFVGIFIFFCVTFSFSVLRRCVARVFCYLLLYKRLILVISSLIVRMLGLRVRHTHNIPWNIITRRTLYWRLCNILMFLFPIRPPKTCAVTYERALQTFCGAVAYLLLLTFLESNAFVESYLLVVTFVLILFYCGMFSSF